MGDRVNVMWSEEHQRLAEKVIKKYAGRMGELGIATRNTTRKGGIEDINRSGTLLFALMLAAGEVEEKDKQPAGQ
jgi:hypothetical protein